MNTDNTKKCITPRFSADFKTFRAVREWKLEKDGLPALAFIGTHSEAMSKADDLNRQHGYSSRNGYQIRATGEKLENEKMLAAFIAEACEQIETYAPRSAWGRGVREYALELLGSCRHTILHCAYLAPFVENRADLESWLMNGADSWLQYSEGSSCCYTWEIAERLLPPSKRKISNSKAMDLQLVAICQAARKIRAIWSSFLKTCNA